MKKLSYIARVLTGAALLRILTLPMSHAQEIAIPAFLDWQLDWTRGYMNVYWRRPIDLDGDGTPEFTMASMRTQGSGGVWPSDYSMVDRTTALFASKSVEMYLGPTRPGPRTCTPEAVLAEGTRIPANPPADSAWQWRNPWDYPALKGVGFGDTIRTLYYSNHPDSYEGWAIGYIKTTHSTIITNIVVGFRIPAPDGYRCGWVQLMMVLDPRPPKTAEEIIIADYAVHPQPGKDMVAGEHVGPLLSLSTGSNAVTLTWSTNATNAVLQQKLKLSDPAWVEVPGITNSQYTVTPTNPSSFYRLKTIP